MGRKQIYLTEDERLAASRAKSKRYYEKKRVEINNRRRKTYKQKNVKQSKNKESCPQGEAEASEKSDPLAIRVEYSERLNRQLIKITNGSAAEFVDELCRQFMYNLNSEPLDTLTKKLDNILTSMNKCHDEVLQLVGVGSQLDSISKTIQSLRQLISWVDEIACVILVDQRDVFKMYAEKHFMFQDS
ncbi:hypothetical protein HYPSUDRAFT_206513 [Hypholoma sublateritium FD-334 SS-4]|uniref:Uncharacterized protein n=1 Tax=Hypholoma sublateritium (strain FD-334 SS-4) TaxID=945553 RepID=A0A0D2KQZ6_HYPSF|nr:hypothetical protein HYPSUDRAFT_206513 [Hypholoma sublateritium FD-334 SS-4]